MAKNKEINDKVNIAYITHTTQDNRDPIKDSIADVLGAKPIDSKTSEIKEIEKEIQELENEQSMYHSFYVDAYDDNILRGVYISKMEGVRKKIEELKEKIKELEQNI